MSDKRIIELNELLKMLRAEVPGTRESFLVNPDGIIIASDIQAEIDSYEMGKLFISLEKSGQKFANTILKSPGIRFSVWNDKGDIQFFPLAGSFLLVVLSDADSRPGLLLLRVTKLIEALNIILGA